MQRVRDVGPAWSRTERMTATERDADGREEAPAMTEHWHPRFGARQMLVGTWGYLGGAWWAWWMRGPGASSHGRGIWWMGISEQSEGAGGRVRRQAWPDRSSGSSGRGQ